MFRRKAKSVICSGGGSPFFVRRHGTVAVPTDKNKKRQDTTEEEAPEAHKKTAAYYRAEHRMIDALNQQDAYYHRRYTQGERGDNNNAVAKLSSILNYNVRYGEVSITKDLPPMEIIHDGVYYCPVPDDLGYHLPPKFLQEDGVSPMEYVMEGKEELQALAKERSALTGAERAKEAIAAPPPFFLRHYTKHFLNPFFMEKGKLAKNCAQLLGNLLEGKKADPDDAVMFDTVQKPFFHEHLLPDRVGKENTELQSEFLAVRASLSAAMDSVTTDNSDKGSNNNNFNFMVGYPVRQFCVSPVFEYQEYLWQWRAVRAFPRPHYRAAGSSSSSKPKPQRASPQLKTVNLHNLLAYKDKTIKSDKAAERKMETKQQKNEVNTLTSLENYYFMIPFLIYPAKMTPRHVVEDHKVVRPDDYFADAVRQETVIIHDSVYDCIEMQKDFLKSLLKKQEEELNRVGGAVKKAKEKRRRKERLLQTAINDLELYHSKVDFIAQMKDDPLNYYNHRAQYYMPTPVGLLKASNVSYSHNYYDLQNTNTTVEDEKSGTNEKEKLSRWSSHFF
ncbi:hypothetical protein ADEAN_000517300 [Angomonas deanei]|uniref:Uncharacterized protein n=1 Tax=Angomonas deanei TaxID=59799 RepID=A0A7G2CG63_9TRYP|nr:hypothetical protein ADEAN_000517300 [Angomonas deanei]